jgi:phosphocarrier protein HPr
MATNEQKVTVAHENGLHARPASEFVKLASQFEADIRLTAEDGKEGDAKSSLAIMSLGVDSGDGILIQSEGPDSEEAVRALTDLVEENFRLDDGDETATS